MTFLYLKSNQMGNGTDAALGEKLLTLFLEKLAAQEAPIDLIGCVNSAVYLTTRDGPRWKVCGFLSAAAHASQAMPRVSTT